MITDDMAERYRRAIRDLSNSGLWRQWQRELDLAAVRRLLALQSKDQPCPAMTTTPADITGLIKRLRDTLAVLFANGFHGQAADVSDAIDALSSLSAGRRRR